MGLPEHKYYTLKQAAKKANCEIEDLIHFVCIGLLEVCVKIPPLGTFFSIQDSEDDKDEEVKVILIESTSSLNDPEARLLHDDARTHPDRELINTNEPFFGELELSRRRYFYKSEYFQVTEYYDQLKGRKGIEKWGGMLAVPTLWFEDVEHALVDDLNATVMFDILSPPRTDKQAHHPLYEVGDFYLDDWTEVTGHELYITNYEFKILMAGGMKTTDVGIRRGVNQQDLRAGNKAVKENYSKQKASLIRSLIELSFLSDGGIEKLSMESISEQLQAKFKQNNIGYEDISPANIRNYLGKAKGR